MKIIALFLGFCLAFGVADAAIYLFGGSGVVALVAAFATVWVALFAWSNGFTGISPAKKKM